MKTLILILISAFASVQAQTVCNCTITPFKPNPPCYDYCTKDFVKKHKLNYLTSYSYDNELQIIGLQIVNQNDIQIIYTRNSSIDSVSVYRFNKTNISTVLKQKVGITDPSVLEDLENELNKGYKNYLDSSSVFPKFSLIGTGLANFVGSQKNTHTTGATAALGFSVRNTEYQSITAIITVAETRDTVKSQKQSDFGTSLLVPGIRRFSLLVNYRNYEFLSKNHRWGLGLFGNVTPMIWETNAPGNDTVPVSKTVIPMNSEVYLSYIVMDNRTKKENPVWLSLDFGTSFRYLGGDKLTATERNYFLDQNVNKWWGGFGGLDVHFNDSRAYFYIAYNPHSTPGLSNIQAFAGITLSAKLFSSNKEKQD